MKLTKAIQFILIICSSFIFGQQKITHKVEKGETVYAIAKKYKVKEKDIFELNPKAKNGLQLNMLLQIPSKEEKAEAAIEPIYHEILPKETLFGISKQYKVSIKKIKELNPFIETEGLKIGSKIKLPKEAVKDNSTPVENKTNEYSIKVVENSDKKIENLSVSTDNSDVTHEVLPKETKYGISRKYGVSIADLETLNPEIKNDLPIGYKLIIKKGKKEDVVQVQNKPQINSQKSEKQIEVKPQIEETVSTSKEETVSASKEEVDEEEVEEVKAVVVAPPLSADNLTKAEFLIAKASENLGTRYRSGATGNGGFDCSGLMFATFKNLDITLPRSSADMAQNAGVRVEKSQAQKGDLIFFETFGKGRISHVGMITEVLEEEIKFIHSSTSLGVIISSTKEPYYAKRFAQINRVLKE
ncbi:MAG: LysM peptidoglycan-binding domain-containing protein [Limnohabitans sp.]|nr:LysM peptidoglycan-binding domain-containing protein [Limnohabitans sp.]